MIRIPPTQAVPRVLTIGAWFALWVKQKKVDKRKEENTGRGDISTLTHTERDYIDLHLKFTRTQ